MRNGRGEAEIGQRETERNVYTRVETGRGWEGGDEGGRERKPGAGGGGGGNRVVERRGRGCRNGSLNFSNN